MVESEIGIIATYISLRPTKIHREAQENNTETMYFKGRRFTAITAQCPTYNRSENYL